MYVTGHFLLTSLLLNSINKETGKNEFILFEIKPRNNNCGNPNCTGRIVNVGSAAYILSANNFTFSDFQSDRNYVPFIAYGRLSNVSTSISSMVP